MNKWDPGTSAVVIFVGVTGVGNGAGGGGRRVISGDNNAEEGGCSMRPFL